MQEEPHPEKGKGTLTVLTTYRCGGGINPQDAHDLEYLQTLQPGENPPTTYHCDQHGIDAPWSGEMQNLDERIKTLEMYHEVQRLRRELGGFSEN